MRFLGQLLVMARPHLVLALGWGLILPPAVLALLFDKGAPIQTDFGLIPVIKGEVDYVIAETLRRRLSAAGASLHLIPISAEVDQGPVLLREVVPVQPGDDAASLEARVHVAEKKMVQQLVQYYQETGTLPRPIVDEAN